MRNPEVLEAFFRNLKRLGVDTKPLMHTIAAWYDREIDKTFLTSGNNIGKKRRALARDTVYTPAGTRRIRYGTDKKRKRNWKELIAYRKRLMQQGKWKWGQTGFLPGYHGNPRYRTNLDRPLLSSGSFMQSFQILRVTRSMARIGTRWNTKLAQGITRGRPVIGMTKRMRRDINKKVRRWIRRHAA